MARPDRLEILPLPEKRGLSRLEAANYVGIGASKFDMMVADGRMPSPKQIDGRLVWDRKRLDEAFEGLPDRDAAPDRSQGSDEYARGFAV